MSIAITAKQNMTILEAINQYGKQLIGFIRSKVPSQEDAEDIMQDVWYQLSAVEELETIDSMSGWLYRVAKNKITDSFRKKKTKPLEDFAYETEDGEMIFREILQSESRTPEDEYFKNLFWEELQTALDELPEKQRYVFVQNELEFVSLQEIANETGENLKTIISRKGYAVKFLKQRMNLIYHDLIS